MSLGKCVFDSETKLIDPIFGNENCDQSMFLTDQVLASLNN
jgi:hypothetical protein